MIRFIAKHSYRWIKYLIYINHISNKQQTSLLCFHVSLSHLSWEWVLTIRFQILTYSTLEYWYPRNCLAVILVNLYPVLLFMGNFTAVIYREEIFHFCWQDRGLDLFNFGIPTCTVVTYIVSAKLSDSQGYTRPLVYF